MNALQNAINSGKNLSEIRSNIRSLNDSDMESAGWAWDARSLDGSPQPRRWQETIIAWTAAQALIMDMFNDEPRDFLTIEDREDDQRPEGKYEFGDSYIDFGDKDDGDSPQIWVMARKINGKRYDIGAWVFPDGTVKLKDDVAWRITDDLEKMGIHPDSPAAEAILKAWEPVAKAWGLAAFEEAMT